MAFLGQAFLAAQKLPAEILDAEQRDRFTSDESEQSRLFYTLLCYGALAAQPAPESVVDSDWRRLGDAGVVDALFAGEFDLKSLRARPAGLAQRQQGQDHRLHPSRRDARYLGPAAAAAAGPGRRRGRPARRLRRGAQVPRLLGGPRDAPVRPVGRRGAGPLRLRARRAGAQAGRAHGTGGPAGEGRHFRRHEGRLARAPCRAPAGRIAGRLLRPPVSMADQRCEVCDAARMAACPMPHCRWRREHAEA